MKSLRDILDKHTEPLFLFTICLITTALIFILMDLNSLSPDEDMYIYLGKLILNGEYPYNFVRISPLLPSLVSLFLSAGFSVHTIRLLIPLIFMNSALVTTYYFAKTLYTKKEAIIATLVLFSFPFFWKWGLNVLLDIPLITFSLLFLLFFYLGAEKEKKYWFLSAILLALACLLKKSAILLIPPAFLYLLITKKWKLMLTKEFILSAIFVPFFYILVFAIFHVLTASTIDIVGEAQAGIPTIIKNVDVKEVVCLVLAPILLFGIFGFSKRKEDIFVCLSTLSFIIFFLLAGHLRLRYWAPILPLFAIFAASGYLRLRERFTSVEKKKIISLIFVILLLVTFVNAIYTSHAEESEYWGAEELSGYVNSLEGNIATEYRPGYLNASTDKSISLLAGKFDDKWIENNNINYVILSIFREFKRSPVTVYNHPKYGPFDITFVNETYCYHKPPPDYQFQSELYKRLENSSKYEKVKEIYRDEQVIFVVYKVTI